MNIFIYSDESGVLDKVHNEYFVFGGLMFLSKEDRDIWSRKYIAAESTVRSIENLAAETEIKASTVSNGSKTKLYRSLNHTEKFGAVVRQKNLFDAVFFDKKGKQRYLDWLYKMAVKSKFQSLINQGLISPDEVECLYFYVDEHTTATNGIYELRESLEQEFKTGTFNFDYMTYHPPIFNHLKTVKVEYCNSSTKTLVRAADIVANRIYYLVRENNGTVSEVNHLKVFYHP